MKLKELLRQFLQSVNPSRYHHISEKQLGRSFKLFFILFALVFVIFSLLAFPVLMNKASKLSSSIQDIPQANVNISIESSEPVILLQSPNIVLDLNASQRGSSDIVFSQQEYYYSFLGEHNKSYEYSGSVSDISPGFFKTICILLLPGLLIMFGFMILAISLLIVLLLSLVGYAVFYKKLLFRDILVIGLHAILLPLIVFMIVISFLNLWIYCIVLFILLFIAGLFQALRKRKKHSSSHSDSYEINSRNKRKIRSRKKRHDF